MRNKLIIVFIVVIVAAIGGYTALWFKKSEDFKQSLVESIANINSQYAVLSGSEKTPIINYESIETSGFPLSMTFKVVKPTFTIPVTKILTNILAYKAPENNAEWVEKITYSDSIYFSSNLTGDSFSFWSPGERKETMLLGKETRHDISSTSVVPLMCSLKLNKTANNAIFENTQSFLESFLSLDCDGSGLDVRDPTATGNKASPFLFFADKILFKFTHQQITGGNHQVGIKVVTKDAKFFPEIDVIVKDYQNAFNAYLAGSNAPVMDSIALSEYGTQNNNIDIVYSGPLSEDGFKDANAQVHLNINSFNIENDLFKMNLSTNIAGDVQGNQRTTAFKLNSSSEFTPRYDELFTKQTVSWLSSILATDANLSAEDKEFWAKLGKPEDVIHELLPKLSSFGKSTVDIDITASGNNTLQEFIKNGFIELKALSWISPSYGLKLTGNVKSGAQGKMPAGELLINCLNCDAMIDDLGAYTIKVETFVHKASPDHMLYVSKGLVDGIKQFLHALAEKTAENSKDVTIRIQAKDNGEFSFGGKSFFEALGLFGNSIASHIPHEKEAVPETVAPSLSPTKSPLTKPATPAKAPLKH